MTFKKTLEKPDLKSEERTYYCSLKFNFLKIDLESRTLYNCHAAKPHLIDLEWLRKNPGQIFNNPISVQERAQMLRNERNPSCEQNCWPAEDKKCVSPRISQWEGLQFDSVMQSPTTLDLTVGSDCNLSCTYCCKIFSSKWRKDVLEKGSYIIAESDPFRYEANDWDRKIHRQSETFDPNSPDTQLILQEIQKLKGNLKHLIITGGEPLLRVDLLSLLDSFSDVPSIYLFTGLGVPMHRFKAILERVAHISGLSLIISAECIEEFLEFNRYGVRWPDFEEKIRLIEKSGVRFKFQTTLSNLTLFGFGGFYQKYSKTATNEMAVSFVYQPGFMAPNVLDIRSKEKIAMSTQGMPQSLASQIIQTIECEPEELQRKQLGQFLKQFVQRRTDLSLRIYPDHFLKWLEII